MCKTLQFALILNKVHQLYHHVASEYAMLFSLINISFSKKQINNWTATKTWTTFCSWFELNWQNVIKKNRATSSRRLSLFVLQQLVSVRLSGGRTGDMMVLGNVHHKLVLSPDFQALLGQTGRQQQQQQRPWWLFQPLRGGTSELKDLLFHMWNNLFKFCMVPDFIRNVLLPRKQKGRTSVVIPLLWRFKGNRSGRSVPVFVLWLHIYRWVTSHWHCVHTHTSTAANIVVSLTDH